MRGSVVTMDPPAFPEPQEEPGGSCVTRTATGDVQLPQVYAHPSHLRVVLGVLQQLQVRCGFDVLLGEALVGGQLTELEAAFGKDRSLEDVIQHLVACDLRRQMRRRRAEGALPAPGA